MIPSLLIQQPFYLTWKQIFITMIYLPLTIPEIVMYRVNFCLLYEIATYCMKKCKITRKYFTPCVFKEKTSMDDA